MRHPWKQALAATLAALVIAGCSTVQVTRPAAPPPSEPDAVATGHWQFDAGDRPPAERDGYRPPRKLAVLLPLTGSLATASQTVKGISTTMPPQAISVRRANAPKAEGQARSSSE